MVRAAWQLCAVRPADPTVLRGIGGELGRRRALTAPPIRVSSDRQRSSLRAGLCQVTRDEARRVAVNIAKAAGAAPKAILSGAALLALWKREPYWRVGSCHAN